MSWKEFAEWMDKPIEVFRYEVWQQVPQSVASNEIAQLRLENQELKRQLSFKRANAIDVTERPMVTWKKRKS